MKNYKKGMLAASILMALPWSLSHAETDERIHVTTFADENGENAAACSLREAITTAEYNAPFGGCSVGKTRPSVTDVIVLKKGEYTLNSPLVPGSQLNIQGGEMVDWSQKDPVTATYPARLQATTTIKGNGTFTLIDTSNGKASVTLNNLALLNGGGRWGGAILAGGSVYLNQVTIRNSKATEVGGAIYLSGVGSSLTVNDTIFENNQAPRGAVLAMSCIDNLIFTERAIHINRSSILKNGTASTQQVMEFCGYPTIEMNNNTITQNNAHPQTGSIIKYSGDSKPNTQQPSILNNSSLLQINNNTIIDNTAYATFLYDSIGVKSINYNILAYNKGHSCRHLLGAFSDNSKVNVSFSFNALSKVKTNTDYCYLPYPNEKDEEKNKTDSSIDVSKIAQNTLLMPLQVASKFSSYMPVYFLNSHKNPLINLDKAAGCQEVDQRNKTRLAENQLLLLDKVETCDIGAIEQTQLRAVDLQEKNKSQLEILDGFKAERDFFKKLIDDPNVNVDYLKYYQIRHQEYLDKIEKYPQTFKYRQIYYDIFEKSQPHELLNALGASELQGFDKNLYDVKVEVLGVGPDVFTTLNPNDLPTKPDPSLKCEWNADIKQILAYRTDGKIDQLGDFNYCKYTITLKSDANVKSTGVLQSFFTNIPPIAVDDRYTLKWGTDQRIVVDLLVNDHDDGDGKPDVKFYPKGKKPFFVGSNGISTPIKLGKVDSNIHIEAEYQALCPDESGAMCYGGKLTISPKNTFNKFNYSFTYQIFDMDAELSNEATVYLINSATTTDDTRGDDKTPIVKNGPPSSGGSMGILGIIALIGMAGWRYRSKK